MLQQNILRVDNINKETALIIIKNNLRRSQKAYERYLENRTYYNARHIYSSNKIIYLCLSTLLKSNLTQKELDHVFLFLFHLEDWFIQFNALEKNIKDIDSIFLFKNLSDHIPFPKQFLKIFNL